MHPGDRSTTDDPAYDTPTLQTTLFPMPQSHPLPIREFLTTDQPRHRLAHQGVTALSDAELLAVITGMPGLETTQRLRIAAGGLHDLLTLSTVELQQLVVGISVGRAAQLKAAIELGMCVARGDRMARRQVKSPADIVDLLLLDCLPLLATRLLGFLVHLEAAAVDGCSKLQVFRYVALPLAKNGLATTAIFVFITVWSEFGLALNLTGSPAARTLPVALYQFIGEFRVAWGPLTAVSTSLLIPALIFTAVMQRHLARGLTFGAVKG